MTLQRLIEGCKKKDRKCQKILYLRYHQLAFNISLRYAKDDHEAKDIVQNAFVNILTKIESYKEGKGSFEGWISKVVINEALQIYRKNQKVSYNSSDMTLLDAEVDPPVLQQLMAEDILELLRQLPDGYRLVFVLAEIEGFKHKEIAEKLGIAESASRSQLARAKKMLRKLFKEQNSLGHAKRFTG